jgi:hypothetical protein
MRGYSDYSEKDARPEGQTAAEIKREAIEAEVAAEPAPAAHQIDIRFTDHGSLVVAVGVSVKGEEWLAAHLDPNGQRWGKNGFVIEPRYVQDIVYGAQDDGLDVA